MSTTWGQNTWGSNSWQSNQNFADPSSITISLSVESVAAFPSTGWGGKAWGQNEWSNLNDVSPQVTGFGLTATLGTETAEGILNTGWGRKNWGEESWGIGGSVLAPSFNLTTAIESVTVTAEVNIGWGGLTWGSGDWGDLANPDVLVSGQEIETSIASVTTTANANVELTGFELTLINGGAVGGTSVDLTAPSQQFTISEGSVFAGELVVVPVTSPAHDEWGTESWGSGQWGVGDGVTVFVSNASTITGDGLVELTGVQATSQTGTLGQASFYEFSSVTATVSLTSVFGGEVVEVQVTSASATQWGKGAFGDGQWGQGVGTDISQGGEEVVVPSIDVPVTGIELSENIGSVTTQANADVFPNGVSLTGTLGDEDAIPNTQVSLSGIEITFTLQGVVAGASAEVDLTGVTMTPNAGTIGLNAWRLVDPGTGPTWTVVDKAA